MDIDVTYLVFGRETGQNGTPHLQGCVTFVTSKRLSALKLILARAHWEKAINLDSARMYCMKDGDYVIRDNRKQGKRTDLEQATNTLKTKGIIATALEHPETFVKFHAGLHKLHYMSLLGKQQIRNVTVHWLFGSTGTGKTRAIWNVAGDDLWASHPGQGVNWFDGYYGQSNVIFDDFRANLIKFEDFLRILDVYPLQNSIKGGMTHWTPDVIFITSPLKPRSCYGLIDEDVNQLLRRIHYTWEFPKDRKEFYEHFGKKSDHPDDEDEEHAHDQDEPSDHDFTLNQSQIIDLTE